MNNTPDINAHAHADSENLTVDFTTANMIGLLNACRALRELENLLDMLCGTNNNNRILILLRHMDTLLQDLSPVYIEDSDPDSELFTHILSDDTLGLSVKARLLMGIKEDLDLYKLHPEQLSGTQKDEPIPVPGDKSGPSIPFNVSDMENLLNALYGYRCLAEVLEMFNGVYPEHRIIFGLGHLNDLIEDLSPLFDIDYDNDDEENEKFTCVMEDPDIGLNGKARILMGWSS